MKREGTYVYLWLIHTDIWKKLTQYYKAIILQLKINTFNYIKKKRGSRHVGIPEMGQKRRCAERSLEAGIL